MNVIVTYLHYMHIKMWARPPSIDECMDDVCINFLLKQGHTRPKPKVSFMVNDVGLLGHYMFLAKWWVVTFTMVTTNCSERHHYQIVKG